MTDIPNILLYNTGDKGGSSEVTVYTTNVEEIINKKLVNVVPGQSSANWSLGPKDTKIVDLLRVEERFSVNGYIDESDKTKFKAFITKGGTVTMEWESETFEINIDKLTVTKNNKAEDTDRDVMFTAIVGVDI